MTWHYILALALVVPTAHAARYVDLSALELVAACRSSDAAQVAMCNGYLRASLEARLISPERSSVQKGECFGQELPDAAYALERLRAAIMPSERSAKEAAAAAVKSTYPCG